MAPIHLLPHKKFYKVDISEFTGYEKTSTLGLISKIWHVAIGRHSSSSNMLCRIETFRREQDDSTMQQSERVLWSRLAMINDDVTFLLNDYGQPVGINNWEALRKKAQETCLAIREGFDGELIENLLARITTLYNEASLLLPELIAYKQFGMLTLGLYSNDLNTKVRNNILGMQEGTKAEVKECFTKSDMKEGFIYFNMEGTLQNSPVNIPRVGSYDGEFTFEPETSAIHKAKIEIAYSGDGYSKKRTYALQALSDKDIEYI